MNTIRYRKSAVFGRFLVCVGFVVVSLLLLVLPAIFEATFLRKVFSLTAGIAGLWFFGKMLILMGVLLVKKPILLEYDSENCSIQGRTFSRKKIKKVVFQSSAPVGMLAIRTPGYVLQCEEEGNFTIPTYHVLSIAEEKEIKKVVKR
jgi:hypothetical protein